MKRQILLYAALLFNIMFIKADPLLVAVLMVKNEESVMEMTLQPLVDADITDFLIYDTGSTDDTIKIIQQFFIKNNIVNFVIEQGEWIDFAASRNKALELTEQHFPQATFMLMLDAEWILHNGKDLLQFCKQEKYQTSIAYQLRTLVFRDDILSPELSALDLVVKRLIRCRSKVYFVGKVHEQLDTLTFEHVPETIYCTFRPTSKGQDKSQQRWLRDRNILLKEVENNPNDARAVFILAQTLAGLDELDAAATWYEHRLTLSGDPEELYMSLYRLAHVYQELNNPEKAIFHYFQAFTMRPDRAEPLILLAEYLYNLKAYHLSFLFAQSAAKMPYPDKDAVLVLKFLYDFTRYNLLSATAYYVGDFELGKQATIKALQVCPNLDCLHKNLAYYESMLEQYAPKGTL